MDKETQDLRKLKKEVYDKGLNIYALVNKMSRLSNYELPPIVIERICREYLRQRNSIRNPWTWSNKVFKIIRDSAYVSSKAGEEKENKKVNTELLNKLLGGMLNGKNIG